MIAAFTRTYSLLALKTFRWFFVLSGPLMTSLYLLAVKPNGISQLANEVQLRLALYLFLASVAVWLIHLFLIHPLLIKRFTVFTTLVYLAYIHFLIAVVNFSVPEVYIFDALFDWYWFREYFLPMTMLQGLVLSALWIGVHAGYLLRKKHQQQKETLQENLIP